MASKSALPIRKCGENGVFQLPCVGVGAWSFGSAQGEYWGERDLSKCTAVIESALEYGPMYIDTAEVYFDGKSETIIGGVLKESKNGKNAIIGTKILPNNCGDVEGHLTTSLKNLQMDSCYLYMVHWPINEKTCPKGVPDITKCFKELMRLQAAGKITHIGVSNFGVKQMAEALATGAKIVVNQLNYALFSRAIEFEIIDVCQKNNIGVIAYSPLIQGLLTDAAEIDKMSDYRTRTRHFAGTRNRSRHRGPGCEKELAEALAKVKVVAKRENRPVAELAISWLLANPAVVCVICGASKPSQIESNFAAAFKPLSKELKAELDQISDKVKHAMGPCADYYAATEDSRVDFTEVAQMGA